VARRSRDGRSLRNFTLRQNLTVRPYAIRFLRFRTVGDAGPYGWLIHRHPPPFRRSAESPSAAPLTHSRLKARMPCGSIETAEPQNPTRAPECGAANPVRARTVAPRSQTAPFTAHKPFANAAKAVVKIPSCGRAFKRGASTENFSFGRSLFSSQEKRLENPTCTNKSGNLQPHTPAIGLTNEPFPTTHRKSNGKPPLREQFNRSRRFSLPERGGAAEKAFTNLGFCAIMRGHRPTAR